MYLDRPWETPENSVDFWTEALRSCWRTAAEDLGGCRLQEEILFWHGRLRGRNNAAADRCTLAALRWAQQRRRWQALLRGSRSKHAAPASWAGSPSGPEPWQPAQVGGTCAWVGCQNRVKRGKRGWKPGTGLIWQMLVGRLVLAISCVCSSATLAAKYDGPWVEGKG